MLHRRPFLFISLLASLVAGPVASWAQVTTLPSSASVVVPETRLATQRPGAKAPAAASDLPLLALLGIGLLLTGAGMVNSVRPSRHRA